MFAYGQTGSGKTHTMQGQDFEDIKHQGIVPRMVRTLFNKIENSSETIEFTVKVSMMEIYLERIKDLLNPIRHNMKIKEDPKKGIFIPDLTEKYIGEASEVYEIMNEGNSNRKTSSTNMNDVSSRSHSIFMLTVSQKNEEEGSVKVGKLYLVDLAGSEKVGKTGATGQTLEEAKKINQSLSSLAGVIKALTTKSATHIPYRYS